MNLDAIEMLSIDQRSIANLLKLLKGGSAQCQLNKMMDNISWRLGKEPNMILRGKVSKVDVVAESILSMDLINAPFAYYIVEVVDGITGNSLCNAPYSIESENIESVISSSLLSATSKSQFVGACICAENELVSMKINCYIFIDCLNAQDLFTNKFMKKITIVGTADSVVHIRIVV
jgi:hypothetical protein